MAPSGTSRPSQYNEVSFKLSDDDFARGAGVADILLGATGAEGIAIGLEVVEFGKGRVVGTRSDGTGPIVATLRLATGAAVTTGANLVGRFVAVVTTGAGVGTIPSAGAAVPDMETGGSVEVLATGEATDAE
jgi:hypothetical protein